MEGRLTRDFSLEAGLLYRPLNYRVDVSYVPAPDSATINSSSSGHQNTWQIPVLLKYKLPVGGREARWRPFVEAGPSFRLHEQSWPADPSDVGISAGAGIAYRAGRFEFAPRLRYTRWRSDASPYHTHTKPDQVEFLTSVSYSPDPGTRPSGGRRVNVGLIAGWPATRSFSPNSAFGERARFLVGIAAGMPLTDRLTLEVDGIYKPLMADQRPYVTGKFTIHTWQIPVLAKYYLTRHDWRPFAVAGPSFRVSSHAESYDPSNVGITAGGGVEKQAGRVRLAPSFRYTRWGTSPLRSYDRWSYATVNRNSAELLVSITF